MPTGIARSGSINHTQSLLLVTAPAKEKLMKIIIVGASGKIGLEIDQAVSERHEVIRVGATSGDVQCDYTSADSVGTCLRQ